MRYVLLSLLVLSACTAEHSLDRRAQGSEESLPADDPLRKHYITDRRSVVNGHRTDPDRFRQMISDTIPDGDTTLDASFASHADSVILTITIRDFLYSRGSTTIYGFTLEEYNTYLAARTKVHGVELSKPRNVRSKW